MFKDKKVLVAGGSGLIGIQLVDLLIQHGARVNVVDLRKPYGRLNFPDTVTFKKMDLTYYTNCISACKDIDYVFNLMCIKGSPKAMKEKPASHLVPMIRFNTNLMEAARECNVRRYLYTSSVGVYHPTEVLVEDDVWKTFPSDNDWYGGWAKRMGELNVKAFMIEYGRNNCSIVRPANIYGEWDVFSDKSTVVASLVKKGYHNDVLEVWGNGTPIRDFIYSKDVACGMLHMVENEVTEPVNLGSGKGVTIREISEIISDYFYKDIFWDSEKPMGDKKRLMSVERAESYGFKPQVSLEDGLVRTMKWYEENVNEL